MPLGGGEVDGPGQCTSASDLLWKGADRTSRPLLLAGDPVLSGHLCHAGCPHGHGARLQTLRETAPSGMVFLGGRRRQLFTDGGRPECAPTAPFSAAPSSVDPVGPFSPHPRLLPAAPGHVHAGPGAGTPAGSQPAFLTLEVPPADDRCQNGQGEPRRGPRTRGAGPATSAAWRVAREPPPRHTALRAASRRS